MYCILILTQYKAEQLTRSFEVLVSWVLEIISVVPDDQARLVFSVRTPAAGERRIPGMPEEDTDTGTVASSQPGDRGVTLTS